MSHVKHPSVLTPLCCRSEPLQEWQLEGTEDKLVESLLDRLKARRIMHGSDAVCLLASDMRA